MKKRMVFLLLILAVVGAPAGCAVSPSLDTSPVVEGSPTDSSLPTGEAAAPTPAPFRQCLSLAGNASNDSGFSVDAVFSVWEGMPGTEQVWIHPGSPNLEMPPMDRTACVIPLSISFANVTDSPALGSAVIARMALQPLNDKDRLLYFADMNWKESESFSIMQSWSNSRRGDTGEIYACLIVERYYSPDGQPGVAETVGQEDSSAMIAINNGACQFAFRFAPTERGIEAVKAEQTDQG